MGVKGGAAASSTRRTVSEISQACRCLKCSLGEIVGADLHVIVNLQKLGKPGSSATNAALNRTGPHAANGCRVLMRQTLSRYEYQCRSLVG